MQITFKINILSKKNENVNDEKLIPHVSVSSLYRALYI